MLVICCRCFTFTNKRKLNTPLSLYLFYFIYKKIVLSFLCSTPVYGASTPQNTASLPAHFVLKLNKPTPMSVSLVKKIEAVTEMECATSDMSSPHPLLSLITQHESDRTRDSDNNKPLFVVSCRFKKKKKSLIGRPVCAYFIRWKSLGRRFIFGLGQIFVSRSVGYHHIYIFSNHSSSNSLCQKIESIFYILSTYSSLECNMIFNKNK